MWDRTVRQGSRKHVRLITIVLGMTAVALAGPSLASATTISVDSTADSGSGCTLRAAIGAASNNTATAGCPAGTATDTIVLPLGVIELDSALPPIDGDITLEGPGPANLTVTRDSPDPFRIFQVAADSTVEISGMTISNGEATIDETVSARGGGIFNGGDLTLDNVRVTDNSAFNHPGAMSAFAEGGGVYSDFGSSLQIFDSRFDDNSTDVESTGDSNGNGFALSAGGAIYSRGPLTIQRSLIDGNETESVSTYYASAYGVIYATDTSEISNSTISFNDATANAGTSNGLTFGPAFSSVADAEQMATLNQVTVTGNESNSTGLTTVERGAIYIGNGPGTIRSLTLSNNTGNDGNGIYLNGFGQVLTVTNSILADPGGFFGLCAAVNGSFLSGGFNLTEGGACFAAPQASDIVGDPLLGVLGDNGGPTLTQLPAPNSPAIDAGTNATGFGADQRGETRPRNLVAVADATGGDGTDIGAVERQTTTASPKSLDLGSVDPGSVTEGQQVTYGLADTGPFTMGTLTLSGTNSADFEITGDECSSVVLSGGGSLFCNALVRFAPDGVTPGPRNAYLAITDSGSSSAVFVDLTGVVNDVTAPATTITGFKLKAKKRQATLRFNGSDDVPAALTFQCSFDGKPFAACTSPKVYKRLKFGRHVFKVRAADASGNADATPAVKRFKLNKPRKR